MTLRVGTWLAALIVALVLWFVWGRPAPYDSILAETVFQQAMEAYRMAGLQCEDMEKLISCARDTPDRFPEQALQFVRHGGSVPESAEEAIDLLHRMMQTGSVMPWSGKAMDDVSCAALLTLPSERKEDSRRTAEQLATLVVGTGEEAKPLNAYLEAMESLNEKDAQIAAYLYLLACEPHMTGPYAEADKGVGFEIMIPTQEAARKAAATSAEDPQQALLQLDEERGALLAFLVDGKPEN